ncbi:MULTISPECIES: NUDIX domain-containing protein [unclassified Saccharopolyspora]|uniref:NUDIX domain-containing protein n=1 Tax=unclassified Saccharopolyspora TaxID=2646250 RepID=UPI001CD1A6EE|nr:MULTISPECIES: NUDIX domain-containing protein [unclassified Saccharopolyspora]MCA1188507.1 NUDIX domain-containing protein [Saccharopolyspora sp. 6T]MCA1194154.1 NUDIX domain-containing protein [Saccharopolyspora sp. 6V]MCA1228106.1 NUDIX domain-containing protein [Saccharopolyspora sp. 6M]MCA1278288.1 NUDIX domain-containing protein [Saccharopolyspora sp. 7B]
MAKRSAGILLHRMRAGSPEVLLVHPGGPFWRNKDSGAWSLPKGEYDSGEEPLAAALREFEEETGFRPDTSALVELGEVRQKGGKVVTAWAAAGDFDVAELRSNEVELPWPPRSGRTTTFPEVDRAEWFDPDAAQRKLVAAQAEFVPRLLRALGLD